MKPPELRGRSFGEAQGSDSLPLSSCPDLPAFISESLSEQLEVTGSARVKLWVSSTARDADFTAKLIDLYPPSADYPDGYALNLTDAIIRMLFRESWTNPTAITPAEVYEVATYPIAISRAPLRARRWRSR
jgi:uncharacterized protein